MPAVSQDFSDISRECDFDGVGNVCGFFFSIFIAVIPTLLLCQLQANSPGAEIPSSETGREFRRSSFTSSIKREIKRFYVVVVQWWQKECTKKCATLAKLLFCMLSWRGCRHTLFVSDAPCKRFTLYWVGLCRSLRTWIDNMIGPGVCRLIYASWRMLLVRKPPRVEELSDWKELTLINTKETRKGGQIWKK